MISPRLLAGGIGAVAGVFVPASAAHAHGLGGRADLPPPVWMFAYGAAAVLIVSFTALAVFWPRPRLQDTGQRGLVVLPGAAAQAALVVCRVVGLAALGIVVAAAFVGVDLALDNLAPVMVFIIVWVGVMVAFTVGGLALLLGG